MTIVTVGEAQKDVRDFHCTVIPRIIEKLEVNTIEWMFRSSKISCYHRVSELTRSKLLKEIEASCLRKNEGTPTVRLLNILIREDFRVRFEQLNP